MSKPELIPSADRRGTSLWRDTRGVTAIEYGVLVGAVALAIIVVVMLIGDDLTAFFNNIHNSWN